MLFFSGGGSGLSLGTADLSSADLKALAFACFVVGVGITTNSMEFLAFFCFSFFGDFARRLQPKLLEMRKRTSKVGLTISAVILSPDGEVAVV